MRHWRLKAWMFPVISLTVAAISLAVTLYLVDRIGERIIDDQAQAAAIAERNYMTTLAQEDGLSALITALDRRERIHGGGGFRYALVDQAGHPLAGAKSLTEAAAAKGWRVIELHNAGRQTRWHVLVGSLPSGENLVIAQDAEERKAFRLSILRSSSLALLFAAIACTGIGMILSALLLRRAGTIAATAERIAAGELHARVEVTRPGDVFDRLGASINAMLSRIEDLMTGMRTVTDSLAHDLRMPLTRLKGALARAMEPGLSREASLEAIAQAHQEADRALATFSALIDIARAETGLSQEMMSDVDISDLASNMADLFTPMIEDFGQFIKLEMPQQHIVGRGHELLLRQAIGNLLHNGAAYAGRGATIVLSVEKVDDEKVRIVVSDTGPGVPKEDRGRVQQRFVRLDKARSTNGSGLGLAIVAACAKLHGGELRLEDNHPGLRAVIDLKIKTANPPP